MQTIKAHTHDERTTVIGKLIPHIKQQLGENLIGLASSGSYARNEDIDFSDVELVAFVKKPLKIEWETRKIVDGLYIVVVTNTKEEYIRKYLDISDIWYASGRDKLEAIINEELIKELNEYKPSNVEAKCLTQIQQRWHLFQEITAKTLNTITQQNRDGLPIIFSQMVKELLIILSYLNTAPYTTLGKYVSEAKRFPVKPEGFDKLVEVLVTGQYQNLTALQDIMETVFSNLENILEDKGLKLYQDNQTENRQQEVKNTNL